MKKLKKLIASLIILLLSFGPITGLPAVYADDINPENTEASPSPTPEPTVSIEVTNTETTVTTEVESTADSGGITITPSPSPLASPEPLDEGGSPDPSASPEPESVTGDAVSVVDVNNEVNTTQINSQVIYKTLNIFVSGNIDLTDSGSLQTITEQALAGSPAEETTVSVSYDGTNVARVSNDLVSVANTSGATNTGDAYSLVSLLNQVNTTIIDSQLYFITINIFGDVAGNIILPELQSESACESPCGESQQISITNQATVNSIISSQAISSPEVITASTDTVIEGGDAASVVNVVNVVNETLINTNVVQLVINVLGEWIGEWLGADQWTGSAADATTDCSGCVNDITINNQAEVDNQIVSLADTSGGTTTGNAYSSVSLFNFINTSIINSTGFWGFINIFGSLTGNVGTEAVLYPSPSPEPLASVETAQETKTTEPGPEVREDGGLLAVSQSNNVGEYILPGDTVTFNIQVTNPGAGRVYDTEIWLGLVKDGADVGGSFLELGNIDAKKGVKISTGLELSELAEGGNYQAVVEVAGVTGPENLPLTASAESNFLIAALSPIVEALATPVQADGPGNVLGTTIAAGVTPYEKLLKLFWIMLALYALMLAIEKREKLAYAGLALRSLIFSLLAMIKTP